MRSLSTPAVVECLEVLRCPVCGHVDLDFEFLDHKRVRCSLDECRAFVRVTHYKAFIHEPGEDQDVVEYLGEAEAAA